MNRLFEAFESTGPIGTIHTAAPKPLAFAPGVFRLSLSGVVGAAESISLAKVQHQLARVDFTHLHIELNSSGGDSREGFAIYDHLRSLPVPISVRVTSQCFSAGLDILVAGSYRFATAQAVFLVHPTSRTNSDLPDRVTTHNLTEAAAELARTDARVVDLLSNRTGTGRDYFEKEIRNEEPMTAAEAFRCGLVHEIQDLTSKVDPQWPDLIRTQKFGTILIDRKLFAPSFLSACRTSATLYDWDALG
ncbi:ATP-dependent Clp protease proteolytic subunit [Bradyrhizobium sp. JYMT SZCCT0428]|uniref:ATP-dependent Clp protease proteolytic subunit n=1 Tax=Bradyrhizobium sp. JYMT SZCCT0428 TaxID=2807673 RepID=UPI001BAB6E18|nr:ATP-dependent Clp protease proteolytic subunit [Bradyrhizobium sp. JYMT SZCCT0428]MBR1151930.1 ATP-dependent Clp protease proteolytic subunit [Bradyrhizobium sp. JYMT SZCCT0428]